jgi:hypothetical protein
VPRKAKATESARDDIVRIERERPKPTAYLVLWWHLQKLYCGLFSTEEEANLQAMSRNGVVVEITGDNTAIGRIADYWRRDDQGNPLPAEWLTARFATA